MKKFKLKKVIKEIHFYEAEIEADSKEEAEDMLKNDSKHRYGVEYSQIPKPQFELIDQCVTEI